MDRIKYNRAIELDSEILKRKALLRRLQDKNHPKKCCGVEMTDQMVKLMIDLCEQEYNDLSRQFDEL